MGAKHASTICTVNKLGLLNSNKGRLEDAEKILTHALVKGAEHVDTWTRLPTKKAFGMLMRLDLAHQKAERAKHEALLKVSYPFAQMFRLFFVRFARRD